MNLEDIAKEAKQCERCILAKYRRQVVVGDIGRVGGVCFIGEAPGESEDIQGRPFVGRSGKLLDRMLNEIELSRDEVSVLNIVKCRPPNNRNPTAEESEICASQWLKPQLKILRPRIIVTLGAVALNYFFPRKRITRTVAQLQALKDGTGLFPMFHPAFILRKGQYELYQNHFKLLKDVIEGGYVERGLEEKNTQLTLDDFFS